MEALSRSGEWSRLFPASGAAHPQVLHARFVRHEYSRHTHDEFVVGVIVEGVQRLGLMKTLNYAPRGSVVFINPGEAHDGGAGVSEGYFYRTVYPGADLMSSAASEFGITQLPQFTSVVVDDPLLARLLTHYHNSIAAGATSLEQETLLRHALALMVRNHMNVEAARLEPISTSREVSQARDYLAADLASDVSLTQLARAVGMSPFHLARAFTISFGLPPHAFRDGLRVRQAMRLLASGQTLAEVAPAVGFYDQSHLTRRFKKIVGVSPGQFVRAQRGPSDG